MQSQRPLLQLEEKVLNREVIKDGKILKKNAKFFFTGKYYSSENEDIILKSNFNTGKLFSPIKTC